MATDNYFKVLTRDRCHDFFFDSSHPGSVQLARSNACAFADALGSGVAISIFRHIPGHFETPCVGGCEYCAPATVREVVEAPGASDV